MSERRPTYDLDHEPLPDIDERFLPASWYGQGIVISPSLDGAPLRFGTLRETNVVGLLVELKESSPIVAFLPWSSVSRVVRYG